MTSAAVVAVERLTEFRGVVGPHVEPLLCDLIASSGFNDPLTLLNPLGQPLVQIPLWVTEALPGPGRVPDSTLHDLVEAALAGYLHVRLQDDIVDGDATTDATTAMFLSDALLIRHQSLIARAVGGSPRFWASFESLGYAYGDAMLFERSLHSQGGYSDTDFARVIERSMPLAIPALAVLEAGDGWAQAGAVVAFVRHTVTAGQLVDDLRDAVDDVTAGRRTWVSVRLGGDRGRESLLGTLAFGGFDEVVEAIDHELDQGYTVAEDLGMTSAAAWVDARRGAIDELVETFGTALHPDPPTGRWSRGRFQPGDV